MGDNTLTLGVSGMLKDNALIMFDRETKSVWSHVTGLALAGPLKGRKLKRIAAVPKVRWGQVKVEYPDAKVLQVAGAIAAPTSTYGGYHTSDAVGVRPMSSHPDDRLPPKKLVAGVEINGAAKAYPHDLIAEKSVVHDEVGGTPVVVARVARAEAVVIFDRRVNGRTLTFSPPGADGWMKDVETGSTWNALRGTAVDGPLEGTSLTRLPHIDMYWFGWAAYHPGTKVYRGG